MEGFSLTSEGFQAKHFTADGSDGRFVGTVAETVQAFWSDSWENQTPICQPGVPCDHDDNPLTAMKTYPNGLYPVYDAIFIVRHEVPSSQINADSEFKFCGAAYATVNGNRVLGPGDCEYLRPYELLEGVTDGWTPPARPPGVTLDPITRPPRIGTVAVEREHSTNAGREWLTIEWQEPNDPPQRPRTGWTRVCHEDYYVQYAKSTEPDRPVKEPLDNAGLLSKYSMTLLARVNAFERKIRNEIATVALPHQFDDNGTMKPYQIRIWCGSPIYDDSVKIAQANMPTPPPSESLQVDYGAPVIRPWRFGSRLRGLPPLRPGGTEPKQPWNLTVESDGSKMRVQWSNPHMINPLDITRNRVTKISVDFTRHDPGEYNSRTTPWITTSPSIGWSAAPNGNNLPPTATEYVMQVLADADADNDDVQRRCTAGG